MRSRIFINIFLVLATFVSVYMFWYKNQNIQVQEQPKKEDIVTDSNLPNLGGETTNNLSSTIPPTTAPEEAIISVPMDENLLLKEAFSKKYNKDISTIILSVESKVDNFVKGGVDFDNSGLAATFYAYYDSKISSWNIVAVENGVVACTTIDTFKFPSELIPQCYSYSSGTVVNR